MTRAERKQKAAERVKEQRLRWVESIKSYLLAGMKPIEAVEKLRIEIGYSLEKNPQEKQQITESWNGFIRIFLEECKKPATNPVCSESTLS